MAPVGSYESLMAAIQGGADSVYFGIEQLNMRARSTNNFTTEDLKNIVDIAKENNTRTYLTVNSVIYDQEIPLMKKVVDAAGKNGVNAIIASDMAVINYANAAGVPVHISTQCNISNLEAVRYYSRFADVVVLARELSLKQVAAITKAIKKEQIKGPSGDLLKIEVFVHGALCMSVSGKCYLSLDNMNSSANRGACFQLCRREYLVTDKEEGFQLEVDHGYILSPKDLCTIGFIDKIIAAGVSVFKIEGRARSPEYVKTVTRCYREAIGSYFNGTYTPGKIEDWTRRLQTVFNRGFWDGYYLGKKVGEWTGQYGSKATKRKTYIGKCTNYFTKLGVAEFIIETGTLKTGDEILITGPTTGVVESIATEIRVDLEKVPETKKGDSCSIPVSTFLRRADKLYKVVSEDEG